MVGQEHPAVGGVHVRERAAQPLQERILGHEQRNGDEAARREGVEYLIVETPERVIGIGPAEES